VLTYW